MFIGLMGMVCLAGTVFGGAPIAPVSLVGAVFGGAPIAPTVLGVVVEEGEGPVTEGAKAVEVVGLEG